MQIPSPIFSIMRLKPGPEVAVMLFMPPHEAPSTAAMDAISSSICIKVPPTSGSLTERCSAISVAGVMGYPPKKRHPAARAPSAHATSPVIKYSPVFIAGFIFGLLIVDL